MLGLHNRPFRLGTLQQRQDLRAASHLRSGRFEAFVPFPLGNDVAGSTKGLI